MNRSTHKSLVVAGYLLLLTPICLATGAGASYGWLNCTQVIQDKGLWIFSFVFGILSLLFFAVATVLIRFLRTGFAPAQIRGDVIWLPGAFWSTEIPLAEVVDLHVTKEKKLWLELNSRAPIDLTNWFFIRAEREYFRKALDEALQRSVTSNDNPQSDDSTT